MPKSFGERNGYEQPRLPQVNDLDRETRVALFNAFYHFIEDKLPDNRSSHPHYLYHILFKEYFKSPITALPTYNSEMLEKIRQAFNVTSKWYAPFTLIETMLFKGKEEMYGLEDEFVDGVNAVLEEYNVGFRLINNFFIQITSETEIEELKKVHENATEFSIKGINDHLNASLKLIALKPEPDLRNSIKESISMVGQIARLISGENDLGKALSRLLKEGVITQTLSDKFKIIYSYTNSQDGIRHELMNDANLSIAEARYFLVACSAFTNYLIEKASNKGLLPK